LGVENAPADALIANASQARVAADTTIVLLIIGVDIYFFHIRPKKTQAAAA
jgi:hypothetical protein